MIRPTADNVLIVLEPLPAVSAGGLTLVNLKDPKAHVRGSRTARVIATGPGYYRNSRQLMAGRPYDEPTSVFVPNQVKPGDRVIVDSNPGQDYRLDISIPRSNINAEFVKLLGVQAECRIVREQEIYAVLDDVAEAAE
jgi:co-chaperonin GroES (HSP10)